MPAPFNWLAQEKALAWLKVDAGNTGRADLVNTVRRAAASWCEDQRPDVFTAEDFADADVPDRLIMAGLLATARLFARIDSPNGVVAFDELGAGSILSKDPDVARYLGRVKSPAVG